MLTALLSYLGLNVTSKSTNSAQEKGRLRITSFFFNLAISPHQRQVTEAHKHTYKLCGAYLTQI